MAAKLVGPRSLHLYTDGGVRPDADYPNGTGHCGTGVVIVDALTGAAVVHRARNIGVGTNQQAEIAAVIDGLDVIMQAGLSDLQIDVFSDSAYVVNCFKDEWWRKWVKNGWVNSAKKPVENRPLWELLLSMSGRGDPAKIVPGSPRFVRFNKVKGHSGDVWNEAADKCATDGKNGKEYSTGELK